MKKTIISILASALLLVLTQCKNKDNYTPVDAESANVAISNKHEVVVKEFVDANAYTYVLVKEGEKEYWIAIPLTEVKVGETYTYEGGMEMLNFESKDLNRTFESVVFVENLIDPTAKTEEIKTDGGAMNPHGSSPKTTGNVTSTKIMEGVVLAKDAITLHDLFANKDKYAGKTVTISGKVVSYNPDIMNKNWLHLQDGTSYKGLNDVTVTTLAKVKVDDVISLKGKVVLNKDFGMGYSYEVLIEDATLVK
ncbi:MAG: hypothetical protein KGZ87_03570 [Bacteroidetes bacterium]|jgi:hypothetical protein|nr:hypothetical protein [Bacteroidota bacterium]